MGPEKQKLHVSYKAASTDVGQCPRGGPRKVDLIPDTGGQKGKSRKRPRMAYVATDGVVSFAWRS